MTHAIPGLVGLRPWGPHRRTATGVQEAELDTRFVRRQTHHAAQGINLAHEMTFGDTADRRIARHLGDQIHIHRVQRRLQTHSRGCVRRFTAGMTRTHNHDVVFFVKHHSYFPIQNVEKILPRMSSVTTSPVNSSSAASARYRSNKIIS